MQHVTITDLENLTGFTFRTYPSIYGVDLHVENGTLELAPVESGWWSAQWEFVDAHTDNYILKTDH